jgi:hypothetical protein
VYYLVYNNTTGVVNGCINQKDETKNLLEITEQQYIDFIEGKNNFANYEVQIVDEMPTLQARQVEDHPVVIYRSTSLEEITYVENPNIFVTVSGNLISLSVNIEYKQDSQTLLYVTEKDNPLRFAGSIEIDLATLKNTKSKTFKIPSIVDKPISIYTANKQIKFGLKNEQ